MQTSRSSLFETFDEGDEARYRRIPVDALVIGIFVADLDRPWLDTPFLIQGFVIDSQIELDTLRRHCREVVIDLEKSNAEAVGRLPKSLLEQAPAAGRKPSQQADPAENSPDTGTGWALESPDASAPAERRPEATSLTEDDVDQALRDADPLALEPMAPPPTPSPGAPEPRAKAVPAPEAPARQESKISRETRERFRRFVRETANEPEEAVQEPSSRLSEIGRSLRGLFGRADKTPAVPRQKRDTSKSDMGPDTRLVREREALIQEIDQSLPSGVRRQVYTQARPVAQELPRAQRVARRSEQAIATLMADIRQARPVQLARAKEAVSDMVVSMIDNPDALMWVAHLREADQGVFQHSVRVAIYMIALGRSLGLPREMIEALGLVGVLADVGKTKLPRALLEKPGMLDPTEFAIAKEHVKLGLDALSGSMVLSDEVRRGIHEHHERLDGSGYPQGLAGDDISLYGRIAGIADCFSALLTPRPYARAMAAQDALMSMYEWSGTAFQAALVEQFVQAIGVFPTGSLVELSSGEIAVVLAHNRARRLEPRVVVLTDANRKPLEEPVERDLLRLSKEKSGKPVRIVRGLVAGAFGLKVPTLYGDDPTPILGSA